MNKRSEIGLEQRKNESHCAAILNIAFLIEVGVSKFINHSTVSPSLCPFPFLAWPLPVTHVAFQHKVEVMALLSKPLSYNWMNDNALSKQEAGLNGLVCDQECLQSLLTSSIQLSCWFQFGHENKYSQGLTS